MDLDIDEDELEKQYVGTMQGQRFNAARIQESHCFDSNMQGSLDPRYAVIVEEDIPSYVASLTEMLGGDGRSMCPRHAAVGVEWI